MTIDKTYIITLNIAERKKNVDGQILVHQLKDVIIYDAIDARAYNIRPSCGFTSGMIGCYISHVQLWKEAIRAGYKHIMVCEDDNSFNLNFQIKLEKALQSLPPNYDFALLSHFPQKNNIIIAINDVWQKHSAWWGTNCYLVNLSAVKDKLHLFAKMENQIDVQIGVLANQGLLSIYHLKEPIAKQIGLKTTVQKV